VGRRAAGTTRRAASSKRRLRVGILGAGLMGGKLGSILARAGYEVVFSYSRNPRKLQRLARAAGSNARVGTPREAADDADALLLAVRWTQLEDVLAQTGDLSGRVVLSCSMPMSPDDTELVIGLTSSGAEALAARVPRAQVVCAFGTVPSEVLWPVFEKRRQRARPDLVYCGDDRGAKEIAARLIRDAGFNPVDAGGLRTARFIEPFVLLVAQLAYSGRAPELAYRFERYAK
jgi:8-hydroxy-5-deazaflavin:NADPH oxidoreductase